VPLRRGLALRMSEFNKFYWYECGYLPCTRLLYGNGVKLYCDEHVTEASKRPTTEKAVPKVSPELADMQVENMLLTEQLEDLQKKYDALKRAYEAAFITGKQYTWGDISNAYTWDDLNRSREDYLKYSQVQAKWNPLGGF